MRSRYDKTARLPSLTVLLHNLSAELCEPETQRHEVTCVVGSRLQDGESEMRDAKPEEPPDNNVGCRGGPACTMDCDNVMWRNVM